MKAYDLAPGGLFGVEHFQVFGASGLSLWFWLSAHFVVFPFQLRVVPLKHGPKNIAQDRIDDC